MGTHSRTCLESVKVTKRTVNHELRIATTTLTYRGKIEDIEEIYQKFKLIADTQKDVWMRQLATGNLSNGKTINSTQSNIIEQSAA